MIIFSIRLRELRKDNNLTQKQVAEMLCMKNMSVCDWENGRTEPNMEQLAALAQYFDVTTDYLLGLEDETGAKVQSKYNNSFNNFSNSGKIDIR